MSWDGRDTGWAEAYRIIHGPNGENVPGKNDVNAYVREANDVTGKILEIGCGTGRIYLQLLRDGNDVYGIDISREQLAFLRENAHEWGLEPSVVHADMRSFSFDTTFELIIVPYNVVRYNTTREDQVRCLSAIMDHLSDDGKVIFEFSHPEAKWSSTPRTVKSEFTHDGDDFLLMTTFRLLDEFEQILKIEEKLFREGTRVGENEAQIARIYKREFEHLLRRAGFDDWEVHGNFDGKALESHPETKSMVWHVPHPDR